LHTLLLKNQYNVETYDSTEKSCPCRMDGDLCKRSNTSYGVYPRMKIRLIKSPVSVSMTSTPTVGLREDENMSADLSVSASATK